MARVKGLYILDDIPFHQIYGPEEQRDIAELVDIYAPPQTCADIERTPRLLADAEVVFSGWGGPRLTQAFLDSMPRLKAFFYGAGATSDILTPSVWDRGILVTSAYAANAMPVAEYTLAMILLSLKHTWHYAQQIKQMRSYPPKRPVPGCYGRTVGLISMGMTGRRVRELLRPFDLQVIAYDPFLSADEAARLGVTPRSLMQVFSEADVVSVHTPLLRETVGMIGGEHVAAMKLGSTLINTARGAIIREQEMVDVIQKREDLQVILDVTLPEPPAPESLLYSLPNVLLTPHIAGSMDGECRRMGRFMVDELARYLTHQPMRWVVTPDLARHTSHRPTPAQPPSRGARNRPLVASAVSLAQSSVETT